MNLDKLLYFILIISQDKRDGSFNTLKVPLRNIYVPNKLEHVYLKVFNMIKRIKESKALFKTYFFECRLQLHYRECNTKNME